MKLARSQNWQMPTVCHRFFDFLWYPQILLFLNAGNMAKNDLEYQLRLEIKKQLGKVTKANSPNIYSVIYTTKGN